MQMIKIPELKIEVETEVHDKNRSFDSVTIPEGLRMLTITEAIWLANSKYKNKLNMSRLDNDFFIEQPFKDNKEQNLTAALFRGRCWGGVVHDDCFRLSADGQPSLSDSCLGFRFCRDLKKAKKK